MKGIEKVHIILNTLFCSFRKFQHPNIELARGCWGTICSPRTLVEGILYLKGTIVHMCFRHKELSGAERTGALKLPFHM